MMFLRQIIRKLHNYHKISKILSIIHSFIVLENPKLRWACFDLISTMCEEFPKDFQTECHSGIIPIIMQGLCDKEDFIILEVCKACEKFVKDCDLKLIKKYIHDLVPGVIRILGNFSIINQGLQLLQTFIHKTKTDMEVYFIQLFQILFSFLQTSNDLEAKATAVECLLSLRKTVKRDKFFPFVPQVISILTVLQEAIHAEVLKPQVLNG